MKIFLVDKSRYCGGAERSLALLLKTSPKDADVFLVTDYALEHQAAYEPYAWPRVLRRFNKTKFLLKFLEHYSNYRLARGVLRILSASKFLPLLLKYRPDIVDFNLFRSSDQWDLRMCRLCHIKTVCHIRSLSGQITIPTSVVPLADYFICVSQNVAEGFSEIPDGKKTVIHNAVEIDMEKRSISQAEARKQLQFPQDKFIIGSVAVCEKRKGHDVAIEGFSRLADDFHDVMLFIIGRDITPGQNEIHRLRELSQKYGVADRVRFAEFKPSLMPIVYRALDLVLALSSDGEAFGRVPIEAGGYGRMSMVSNRGAFLETVANNQTGVLVSPRPLDVASKLRQLLQAPECIKAMSENASKEFPQRFSAIANSDKTFQVYKTISRQK